MMEGVTLLSSTGDTNWHYKDPVFNSSGTIDCIIKHPSTGSWVPFTASPDDERGYCRELFTVLRTVAKPYIEG